MPVRRISMASVKMKALKPSLITMKPLKAPTASPTSRTIAIPRNGFQSVPRPWPSFETISQAPTIGADNQEEDDHRKQGEFPDPVGPNVPAMAPQRPGDRLLRPVDRTLYC